MRDESRPIAISLFVLTTIAVFYVLVVGKQFLVPLAVAIMLWYVINALSRLFAKLRKKDKSSNWLTLLASVSSIGLFIYISIGIIQSNINELAVVTPNYKANIDILFNKIVNVFGISTPPSFKQITDGVDIAKLISQMAGVFTSMISNVFLVIIYVLFLILEQGTFKQKITAIFPNSQRRASVMSILSHVQEDIQTYLWIKTLTSSITGVCSYIVLSIVGVDFAVFWAFSIFLLNFVPTIGSIIATFFPAVLALIQFDTLLPFIVVLTLVGVIQVLVGNFLEPKLMGNSLNLSPFVVMLSLTLWGSVWGVAGMFLSVPITVILLIIFAHFKRTHYIAILLSADGNLKNFDALNHEQK